MVNTETQVADGLGGARGGDVPLRGLDASLEAPRPPRSPAQLAAFERACAARAANLAAKGAPAAPAKAAPAKKPPAPAPIPAPAPAPAPAPPAPAPQRSRKQRADKGLPRGHLVRPETPAMPPQPQQQPQRQQMDFYSSFIIV